MTIQDYVNSALNALNEIATNEHVEIDQRISAAEKMLDYAARLNEDQGNKSDTTGFKVGDGEIPEYQDFGGYLRALRKRVGYKYQKQLAEASGISQSTISRIEDGEQHPNHDTLKALAKVLGFPESKLFEKARLVPIDPACSDNQDFGEYLKSLRGKRSLREMENLTGVSHTYLSSLEKGFDPRTGKERKPTPETLEKLAQALGVSYEDIMKRAGYL